MGGVFIGGFCFPHGTISLDPLTRNFANIPAAGSTSQADCIRLHNAMKVQAHVLLSKYPDVIILSTPHGLKLNDSFLFLRNTTANGNAEWDGDWTEFTATLDIDVDSSFVLASRLKAMGNSVETVGIGIPHKDVLPLRWGEVVPMWFIQEAAREHNLPLPPVVFLGQKVYNQGVGGIQETLKLGRDIASVIRNQVTFEGKKVAVVISGDLAHTHSSSQSSPFPFHQTAAPFDSLVVDWAKMDRSSNSLRLHWSDILADAAQTVESARSCGFSGLVMLQGMLEYLEQGENKFQGTVLEYLVPTYYGMMVNYFIPVQQGGGV